MKRNDSDTYQSLNKNGKKKKSFIGSFFSWLFYIIITALVAVIVVGVFIAPITDIKTSSFDVSTISVGEKTLGEILGDSDLTIFGALKILSKAKEYDENLFVQAFDDADKAAVKTLLGKLSGDETAFQTDNNVSNAAITIIDTDYSHHLVPQTVNISGAELAYIFDCVASQSSDQSPISVKNITVKGGAQPKFSVAITVNVKNMTSELPSFAQSLLNFENLTFYIEYDVTKGAALSAGEATVLVGSLNAEDSAFMLNLIAQIVPQTAYITDFSRTYLITFLNHLGEVSEITDDNITVVVG